MTATMSVRGVAAGYGGRTLFTDLDLDVHAGDVVGLVGPNGAGKSTLLRLLAGQGEPLAGVVRYAPGDARAGLLAQERDRGDETVRAYLARRTGVQGADSALQEAATGLETDAPGAADAYASALDAWLALGGADLDARIEEVAVDLGLTPVLDSATSALSGGQAARAGLAVLLLARYDLLLLDEPTNDLDLDGLARLERFVQGARPGIVVVSHDREFLARTATRIVELDLPQQRVRSVDGGYEAYLAERETARRHEREAYDDYDETRTELEQRMRRQQSWADKGMRSLKKRPPDGDRNRRGAAAEATEKQASKVRAMARRIERLDEVEEPRKEWDLRMSIGVAPRAGAVVARLDSAVVRRGSFTLGPVSLQIDWADRVGISGPNGAGKTTLLAALLGRATLDAGSAGLGPGVILGEVDQLRGSFSAEAPLLDVVRQFLADLEPAEVRTLLAKFGLRGEEVHRPAASLSPGERTRAALAVLQGRQVNLLVLDEPTNNLDLPAIEELERALAAYEGTLLLVSHDRRLWDTVDLTRRLQVREGQVREE